MCYFTVKIEFFVIFHLSWLLQQVLSVDHTPSYPFYRDHRRQRGGGQQLADEDKADFVAPTGAVGPDRDVHDDTKHRFSTWSTRAKKTVIRTTPEGFTLDVHCDYIRQECLQAHQTGKLCARTITYHYESFNSLCELEFINCMEGYEVWQVVHMGACFSVTHITDRMHYVYQDDFFLDQYYVQNDH